MKNIWTNLCQKLVPRILEQRDWKLIEDLPAFVARVSETIDQGIVRQRPGTSAETTIQRATVHLYCQKLYQACRQHNTDAQRRAFEEIGQYAQGIAWRYERNLDVIRICVQQTLEILWEKQDQIRDPGSLLGWVDMTLYREIKRYRRKPCQKQETLFSDITSADQENNQDTLMHFPARSGRVSSLDDLVIRRELRAQFWRQVREVFSGNPQQETVIVGQYLDDQSPFALAEILQTSIKSVYVIKCRALKRLRENKIQT